MAELDIDLLAISPSDDLRWLLGFSPTADERACMLLLSSDDESFVVPRLNAEQTRVALPSTPLEAWEDAAGPRRALGRALESVDVPADSAVAIDGAMRADSLLLLQGALTAARFVPAAAVLAPLRAIKDAPELELLAASARTADAAVRAGLVACVAGATEFEVAEAAAAAFRGAGAEEVLHTSVAAGPNGAFPHHHTSGSRLQEGNLVTIDVGGRLRGYASDITRMAYVGEPDERSTQVHAVVEAAVQAALVVACPGATCADVDRAARGVIAEAGLGEYFVHRTGHGLGLSTHELPSIMEGEDTVLVPGMVFSVEPGVYISGELGVRLEEIVRVTETGCEILSNLTRDVYVAGR